MSNSSMCSNVLQVVTGHAPACKVDSCHSPQRSFSFPSPSSDSDSATSTSMPTPLFKPSTETELVERSSAACSKGKRKTCEASVLHSGTIVLSERSTMLEKSETSVASRAIQIGSPHAAQPFRQAYDVAANIPGMIKAAWLHDDAKLMGKAMTAAAMAGMSLSKAMSLSMLEQHTPTLPAWAYSLPEAAVEMLTTPGSVALVFLKDASASGDKPACFAKFAASHTLQRDFEVRSGVARTPSDLVNTFTAFMHPEDLMVSIEAYHKMVAETVLGGTFTGASGPIHYHGERGVRITRPLASHYEARSADFSIYFTNAKDAHACVCYWLPLSAAEAQKQFNPNELVRSETIPMLVVREPVMPISAETPNLFPIQHQLVKREPAAHKQKRPRATPHAPAPSPLSAVSSLGSSTATKEAEKETAHSSASSSPVRNNGHGGDGNDDDGDGDGGVGGVGDGGGGGDGHGGVYSDAEAVSDTRTANVDMRKGDDGDDGTGESRRAAASGQSTAAASAGADGSDAVGWSVEEFLKCI